MEDIELKEIWNAYDKKIEDAKLLNMQSWALNLRVFETMQHQKASSKLNRLAIYKVAVALLGIPWIVLLSVLLYGNHFKNIYFSVSVAMILLFTVIAFVLYIKHAVAISRISYSDSITVVQEKLAALQSSTINAIRFLWLQMPFYTTFFWNSHWMNTDYKFWIVAFPITLLFTALSIWLYINISLKNRNRKWFKWMLGFEWSSIMKAMSFLEEIDDFKKDLIIK